MICTLNFLLYSTSDYSRLSPTTARAVRERKLEEILTLYNFFLAPFLVP